MVFKAWEVRFVGREWEVGVAVVRLRFLEGGSGLSSRPDGTLRPLRV